jgi:hypothetical protein
VGSRWRSNTPSSKVGGSATLTTTWARETAVSRCLLQKPHKQRLQRQVHMATSSAFTLAASRSSHQPRHHEFKGRIINDLQKWRRGWDTHPARLSILACFQQHTSRPHEYWRFLRSQLLQLFQPFRIISTNFGPKQTPKTPRNVAPTYASTNVRLHLRRGQAGEQHLAEGVRQGQEQDHRAAQGVAGQGRVDSQAQSRQERKADRRACG